VMTKRPTPLREVTTLSPSRPGSITRQYLCPLAAASMRADLRVGTAIARSGAPRVDIARIGGVRQA
jgi:hypothetical protein